MNNNVIITCAITGAGDTAGKHPDLPITHKQMCKLHDIDNIGLFIRFWHF